MRYNNNNTYYYCTLTMFLLTSSSLSSSCWAFLWKTACPSRTRRRPSPSILRPTRVFHPHFASSQSMSSVSTLCLSSSSSTASSLSVSEEENGDIQEQTQAQRQALKKAAARAKRKQRIAQKGLPKAMDRGVKGVTVYQPRPFTARSGLPYPDDDTIHSRNNHTQSFFTVLGIESSCDDTGAAVVRSDGVILGEALASQEEIHQEWGGVVPGLARDAHQAAIDTVVDKALEEAGMTSAADVDGIAVTIGPGLEICLRIGATKARSLAMQYDKPFCAIHHLEAHILMARMMGQNGNNNIPSTEDSTSPPPPQPTLSSAPSPQRLEFPFLALLVSGGHCQLLDCHDVGRYDILGGTLDDSLGEALDKTARLLFGPGHGGAALEQWARQGNANAVQLPIPLRYKKNCNFSYAGLKTAVRQAAQQTLVDNAEGGVEDILSLPDTIKADLAASFQNVAFAHIEQRLKYAMTEMEARYAQPKNQENGKPRTLSLAVVGGVAANQELRRRLHAICQKRSSRSTTDTKDDDNDDSLQWQLVVPPPRYCTDQGAMSAWAGVERFWCGSSDDPKVPDGAMDVYARYPFASLARTNKEEEEG